MIATKSQFTTIIKNTSYTGFLKVKTQGSNQMANPSSRLLSTPHFTRKKTAISHPISLFTDVHVATE